MEFKTEQSPDPFGRLSQDDGSQNRFRSITDIFSIQAAVGPSDANDPDDVARVEILMDHVGELDLKTTDGPTGYYGERLKQAIEAFQKKSGLPQTGRITPVDTTMSAVKKTLEGHTAKFATGSGSLPREAMATGFSPEAGNTLMPKA